MDLYVFRGQATKVIVYSKRCLKPSVLRKPFIKTVEVSVRPKGKDRKAYELALPFLRRGEVEAVQGRRPAPKERD